MAPSNMFSYLRPHTKRAAAAAHPASPDGPPLPQPSAHHAPPLPSSSLHSPDFFAASTIPTDSSSFNAGSPVSLYPPTLPPIPRVASRLESSATTSPATSPQPTVHSPQSHEYGRGHVAEGSTTTTTTMYPATQSSREQLSPGSYENRRPPSRPAPAGPSTGYRQKGQSLAEVVEQAVQAESQSNSAYLTPPGIPVSHIASRSQTSLASGMSDKLSNVSKSSSTPTMPPQKSAKSRLNLRNPMSLLMRRRSGQPLENLQDEALVSHRSPPMPDDYDPSIRGRIVHDFSAPRTKRTTSYNNANGEPGDGTTGRVSPQKIEREHTPVFREHFDDDTSYEASQAAIRAEKLANKDFIARNSLPPPPKRTPPLPPPKEVHIIAPPQPAFPPPPPPPPVPEEPPDYFEFSTVLSPVQESSSPTDPRVDESPRKRKSAKTPPSSRSRATSMNDPAFSPAGLPAHLTSRSSRFSFQIAGNDSAQEKLLEERHKQKAAQKASKEVRKSTTTIDDEYDEYGLEDFDMDNGLEEDIPMLGDDDGFGDDSMSPGMSAFDFSSFTLPANDLMSPVSAAGDMGTPRDLEGNAIGFATSNDDRVHKLQSHPLETVATSEEMHGLGLTSLSRGMESLDQYARSDNPPADSKVALDERSAAPVDLGDDFDFDDGMIGDQDDMDAVAFDENIFDDPSGPLFERKIKNAPIEELRSALSAHPPDVLSSETGYEADDDELSRHLGKTEPSLAHKPSMAHQKPTLDLSNINAYHSALADAALRAQAEGRFARKESVASVVTDADDSESLSNSRPSLIPDDGRCSQETTGFPPDDDTFGMSSSFVDDYDYSDYDSTLENDPMIAAANAEALANDDDGFYGQEFGFYAAAQGESTTAYGGFFGPSGLGRTVSGRNAVREPNLTPITERSEYSTRNSFISLNHFRDSQQPLQSPGLAQLARISPYGWTEEDPDMSLNSLMKLKKSAFGGSNISLGSSTGNSPRNSSPMGMQFLPRNASPMANHPIQQGSEDSPPVSDDIEDELDDMEDDALDAVNASADEYDEEGEERSESPTLTATDYDSLSSPMGYLARGIPPMPSYPPPSALPLSSPASHLHHELSPPPTNPLPSPPSLSLATKFPPQPLSINTSLSSPSMHPPSTSGSAPRRQSVGLASPLSTNSPLTPGGTWKPGHSRKSSAADSVAYVREHDEQGGDRWVLERRRTAESGELELVGREIVEGGRI